MDGLSIHVRPDRLTHLELFPHGGIGEADLATDRLVSSSQEMFVNCEADLVAPVQIKTDPTVQR